MKRLSGMALLPVLVLALANAAAGGDRTALVARDTGLRERPQPGAEVRTELPANTKVQVLERRGGWYRVRDHEDSTGWARLLELRFEAAERATLQEEAESLRRFGSGETTAVTGIRGLAAADGELLEVEETELAPVHAQAVSREEARDFASRGGLRSREVASAGDGEERP